MGTPFITAAPTYGIAKDQRRAIREANQRTRSENFGAITLETQDMGREVGYVIYIYNLLNREHLVQQPPFFPRLVIPACERGQKVGYTVIPAFFKETYCRPGTTDYYYKEVDGRKVASSLLNPMALPTTDWGSQQVEYVNSDGVQDQYGNNLNKYGAWWSLTKPDEEARLDKEIALFRKICDTTMQQLVNDGETFAAANDRKSITPWMHFAMEYFGKTAPWHMTAKHMVPCPNCGDMVLEGIAYHRNSFNEKCIIDPVKYKAMMAAQRAAEESDKVPGEDVDEEGEDTTQVSTAAKSPRKKKSKAVPKV